MPGEVSMPGNRVYPNGRAVPKKPAETNVTDIVEVLKELDLKKAGSKNTATAETREPVGMTCDNYYG
jgi:hypothetical protein